MGIAPTPLTGEQRETRVGIVREQIALMRRYAEATGEQQHARWLLKEVIFRVWEEPQIPDPRFGKYSLRLPWSPHARQRLKNYVKGERRPEISGLRFEHLVPRGILAAHLLKHEPADLAGFLDSWFRAAVITTDDDAQLNRHGMRNRMPPGWSLGDDAWARYRAAGFDPADFVPPVRWRPDLL